MSESEASVMISLLAIGISLFNILYLSKVDTDYQRFEGERWWGKIKREWRHKTWLS
jgi:hypothetical protein